MVEPTGLQIKVLQENINELKVEEVLHASKKDGAAGIDGLTYEFWNEIHQQYLQGRQWNTLQHNRTLDSGLSGHTETQDNPFYQLC